MANTAEWPPESGPERAGRSGRVVIDGHLHVKGSSRVWGNLKVDGKINDRDLAQDGAALGKHLAARDNPHQLTAAGLGALPARAYDFARHAVATVAFTANDADGATRLVKVGFRPRFVWATGQFRGGREPGFGGVTSGFGAFEDETIQFGAGPVVAFNTALSSPAGRVSSVLTTAPWLKTDGLAIGLLDDVNHCKSEVVVVRIKTILAYGIQFELKRKPMNAGAPLDQFEMTISVLCFGP